MRRNEFPREVAQKIAVYEDLDQLYKRILQRATLNPTIYRLRDIGIQSGWTVTRTLAAMVFMLMVEEEGTMEELERQMMMRPPRPMYIPVPNPLPVKPVKSEDK